jgi:hypothetical protein
MQIISNRKDHNHKIILPHKMNQAIFKINKS